VPTAAVFVAWDLVAIARHHWTFSHRLTTGFKILPGLPVDELLFFLVVPVCGLLTFEAVRHVLAGDFWRPRRAGRRAA
jgi:lycopene cyclase domain-containing protein